MKKTLVTLLLALVMVLGMALAIVPNAQAAQVNGTAINLLYDDRKDLAELLGTAVSTVEISNQTVTSKDVDGTADEAVLIYENGTLYAVGTGTATLTVNGTAYTVTVSAAPISVFLITGHSVGYGQYGAAGQSVAIEPGQAYSSWWRDSLTSATGGIGYGANTRAGGTGEYAINAFDEGQNGTRGVGSALAYNWNKATGEKVWVMNLAVPGSCINEWLPGVTGWHYDKNGTTKYMYKYESIQEHFGYLQTILANEIAAGHYTLGHIGMMYFSGANFGNANYNDWTYDSLKSDYATFWEGIKKDMSKDIDGDGTADTFDSMGIVPLWTASNQDYRQDKLLNYYMAASADYPDVYIASDVYRTWAAGQLSAFPAINYTTQGTAVAVPTSVAYSESTPNSVFCTADTTHLSQVTYNAVGLDMATNAYSWYNSAATTDVQLQYLDRSVVPASIEVNNGMTSAVMTPVVAAGARGNVKLVTSGNVQVNWPVYIEGTAVGTGTVTAQVGGTTVDSVAVTVLDKHVHCACGGHASGMKDHTCTNIEYQAWGNTDAEKTSLPKSGNYYLVADITVSASTTPTGNVNLCLNGHNITATAANARIYYPGAVTLSITDCGAEADWGTASTQYTGTYGGLFYMNTTASSKGTLNLYAGNFDGSKNTVVWGGVVLTSAGSTLNIYKANLIGGLAARRYVSASQGTRDGRGAAIYVMNGAANIYGGTITGGRAQNQGGNIYLDLGTLNIYGGTISGGKVDGSLGTLTDGKEASGGNLAIERGTVNFSGGTITGGISTKGGGNIAVCSNTNSSGTVYKGTLNISGGTVTGGKATTNGGNIVVYNTTNTSGAVTSAGVLKISGGTITSGVASGHGGNIHMVAGTTCTMTGGTVTAGKAVASTGKQGGNINITGAGTFTMSGGTLSNGIAGGYGGNLCGTPGSTMKISGTAVIKDGATGTNGAGTSGAGGNIFGGGGTSVSNITISGGTISGGKALKGGNINVDGKATISGGTIKDGVVPTGNASAMGGNICTGTREVSSLTITGGTISGGKGYYGGSMAIRINATISGGTISGGRAYKAGGNIYFYNTADTTLTINGKAVIKDGKARYKDTGTNTTDYPADGEKDADGNAITVIGGNLYIYGTATAQGHVVISGGTISGGYANCGGNIYCMGQMEITDGTITKGYARGSNACGANIYQAAVVSNKVATSQITMSGGTVSDGYADGYGGNMQIHGNFTMTGGELLNGSSGNGGNVRVFRPGNFVLDGGTVSGGTCRNLSSSGGTGGNVFQVVGHNPTTAQACEGTLTIKSGTIIGSDSNAVNGGVINISTYGIVNMEGGTITGGTAQDRSWNNVDYPGRGGVFCMYTANHTSGGTTTDRPAILNISGGTINGGTADSYGGIIAVTQSTGTVEINISGGTISGGKAINGGILWTEDDCDVNITGGTISGGEATDGGLFWLGGGANVTVSGGTLEGGTATGKGDGIYVVNANLTIKDQAKLDGAGTNLYVENGSDAAAVTFENISDTLITVDAADKTKAFASSATNCAAYMPCTDEAYKVVWADGKLSFGENVEGTAAAVCVDGKVVAKYPSFAEAAEVAMNSNTYVKLLESLESDFEVTGTLWVDLAGFDLSGITVSGTLYGMDSTTDAYTDTDVGTLTCTVSGEGKVATNCKATSEMLGAVRRYLAIPGDNGTYTFHRFYMGITKITLKPATVGIGYRALFAGSDTVKNYMTGFGYSMWIDGKDKVVKTMGADQFISKDEVTLRVDNIMRPDQYEKNVINAEIDIYGSVFINLITGEKLESSSYVTDFHQVVETIEVQYADFTDTQKQAMVGLHTVYHREMIGWNIPNLHHGEGSDWVAVDTAGLKALLTNNEFTGTVKVYLTEDVTVTAAMRIASGANVSICLNGHTLHSTTRVFNPCGTLNIYDCCGNTGKPGKITSDYTSYGPIMYTYKGSVVNLYGGELVGSTTTPGGGVVVIGNDTTSYTSGTTDSVFNMYGGKIYGGTSTGSGGNIVTFHGGQFNMYGGEVFGGNAAKQGGNISAASGTSDAGDFYINIYGGKIYDGVAGTHGGNISTGSRTHVNIAGGTISGGESGDNGGNIYVATTELTVTDGLIADRTAQKGGNIYTIAPATSITGGTITGGIAVEEEAFNTTYITGGLGGNIYLEPGNTATNVVIKNVTITDGEAVDGGNLYILPTSSLSVVNMENVTLSGGKAENDGGNLAYLNYGTVNLNNVSVINGVAGNDGANIYLFRDMNQANFSVRFPTLNINGGKITGGKAGDKGSGLYVQESVLNLSGNVHLTGNQGSNLYLDAAHTVNLKDLAETAKIGISMNLAGAVSADTAYIGNLVSDNASLKLQTVDGMIKLTGGLSADVPELTGYSVGWYRGDITPQWPVPLDGMGNNYGRMAHFEVKNNLMAGFTVIADETGIENAIILVSVDTLFIQKELADNLSATISEATGIPANRIFYSASHTHCGVDHDGIYEGAREYMESFYNLMTQYAVLAVEDLKPATIQTGAIDIISEEGNSLNMARRYIGDDGNAYSSVDSASYPAPSGAERESHSDTEMQLIRFVREGGTDVVMTNWQSHPSGYSSGTYGYVSAEHWKIFREAVESSVSDTVCTFFLGAAGNLGFNATSALSTFTDPNGTTRDATSWTGKGQTMAGFATYALTNNMTTVEPGELKVANFTFETEDLYRTSNPNNSKGTYGSIDMDLNAICIGGDIAFITSPYEMFHENGSQIKAYAESLGFETCFVLTNSMGENKYIGCYNSFDNDETDGSYTSFGVRTCRFVKGTAELLIDQYADMLAGLAGKTPMDTIYETYTVKVVDASGNAIQNVMIQLVGGNDARNCTDADGTVEFYIYGGIDYAIELVKVPSGYAITDVQYTFDSNNQLTITLGAA